MQSGLLFSDSKKFLDKYKKFITKDIYINHDMVKRFLEEYQYLVDELDKNKFVYQEQDYYKEIFHIYQCSDKLVKLHNQKYLQQHLNDYSDYFEELYSKDKLNKQHQLMILSLENKAMAVIKKNYIPFIVSKIKYMHDYLHYEFNKILILIDDEKDFEQLRHEFDVYEIEDVSIYCLKEYGLLTLKEKEQVMDKDILYQELFHYITVDIYSDKEHFSRLYHLFSSDIFLNRDYKDFDTFKDYHFYMYKRKFLDTGLTLKKYNEREIKKRRGQLRTIRNIVVDSKEMVDVVNFLELNSISYRYDKEKCSVMCTSKNDVIIFGDNGEDHVISLNRDGRFLEVLVYELVNKQYGMERRDDDEIFGILRDTAMDSYFSEFIHKILIPSIYYYQVNGNFDNTLFTEEQVIELKSFYEYYLQYKKKKFYVDVNDLHKRIQDKINHSDMSYFMMLGSDQYQYQYPKDSFVIVKNYPELNIIKGNIRLLYDYKSYLDHHKCLAVPYLFLGSDEVAFYTGMFLKEHLNDLNERIKNNQKNICVCFYDDRNRLKSYVCLNECIYHVLELEKGKDILFGIQDKFDMKYLLIGDFFTKVSQSILHCNYGNVTCDTLFHVDKKFDVVVLPMLIPDSYHQDMFRNDEVNQVKVGLFMGLRQSRERLYVMVPVSQKKKYKKIFDSISNVSYLT